MDEMKKILIVEDEPSYRNLLHSELTAKGYLTIDAKDGKEGYDKAVTIKPDLIILDLLMPGVDGITMLETLRKDKYGKSMNVIILTNLELDSQVMERVLNAKPLFYFVKSDITPSVLVAKIDEEFASQDEKEQTEIANEHAEIL